MKKILLFMCVLTSLGVQGQNYMELGKQAYQNAVNQGRDPNDRQYREALPLLKYAAKEGYGEACYLLGEMYRKGLGMETPDLSIAMRMYERAIEFGYEKGEVELGRMYFYGKGGADRDIQKAYALYRKGLEKGDPSAACYIAMFYFYNELCEAVGNEVDYSEAYRLIMLDFNQVAFCKDVNVMYMLSDFCLNPEFPTPEYSYSERLVATNPVHAAELMYDSGMPQYMYRAILLVDNIKRSDIYRFTSNQKTPLLEAVRQTLRYENLTDLQRGELLYIYAKHALSCWNMVDARHWGYSIVEAMERAAEYGYGPAQKTLGDWYAQGNDHAKVSKNLLKSREWYAKAKANGQEVPEE